MNKLKQHLTVINLICAALCAFYLYLYYQSIKPFWFNPSWTTDDALQQVFSFHKVYHPEIFKGDLITETMEGYLAPLHYWLCYGVTWLTHDPIMMSHWVMLIQLVLTVVFVFLAINQAAGTAPAFLAVAWLMHTRPAIQRITAGLPRGWSAVVLAAFLFFALRKNHKAMLVVLLCGCLLHPPTTLIVALAYGLYLTWGVVRANTRAEFRKPCLNFLLLSPIYLAAVAYVVHRPASTGQMVNYQTALQMPEFQKPNGRFPFVPLDPVFNELTLYGYQPFFHPLYTPGISWHSSKAAPADNCKNNCDVKRIRFKYWRTTLMFLAPACLLALFWLGRRRKREVIPPQLICLCIAIFAVYFASRLLAFKLYVPNRHLQFPMTFFLIAAFCIGVWRFFHRQSAEPSHDSSFKFAWASALAMAVLGVTVWLGTGSGLYGSANFNYSATKRGRAYLWIRRHTPEDAYIAGHPTQIDGVPLFGMRRAYATTEVAHPFYVGYYNEIKRRLIISFKAHYAKNLAEFLSILRPEKIDYFVFSRAKFLPGQVGKEKYFSPLDGLIAGLTTGPDNEYAYRQLPNRVDLVKYPFMPFKDDQAVIVDIKKLNEYLAKPPPENNPVESR